MLNPAKGQSGDGQTHGPGREVRKAAEAQQAGGNAIDSGHAPVLEGGKAESPTEGRGHPKSAASSAPEGATSEGAISTATAGKAEKEAAAAAGAAKEQHGRGHRKSE